MNQNKKYTFTNETQRRANTASNTQRTTQTVNRTQQATRKQQPVQPKMEVNQQNNNADVKGCLSFMLAFWFRSAVLSIAIYLAMQFLGLLGGNDFVLNKESKVGPVTFQTQEYDLTDQDIETFSALMNDELLSEEQKEIVYSLGK